MFARKGTYPARPATPRAARPVLPPNGVIVYDGPSTLDGAPVVVVLTSLRGASTNSKTSGDALPLAQTYVIPRAMLPAPGSAGPDASRAWFQNMAAGCDAGACGACPLRPSTVAALKSQGLPAPDPCYVLNGPPDVARAVADGKYPTVTLDVAAGYVRAMLAAGRIAGVRGGSWGDPAAAPFYVHAALFDAVHDTAGRRARVAHPDGRERRAVWTCYTRTWAYAPAVATPWRLLAMASAHNPAEARAALAAGWRPFVVVDGRSPDAVADAVALVSAGPSTHCPASTERDLDATCSTCGLCDGSRADIPADPRGPVVIMSHGNANRSAAAACRAVAALQAMDDARRARAAAR
jgi:hypothetical protein